MNIIVTGASRGIGYATVHHLAREKTNAILAISRNEPNLIQLRDECQKLGNQNVLVKSFDLRNDDISVLLETINECFSHLDILINNAGALINRPFAAVTKDEAHHVFDVNFFKPFELIQLTLPFLRLSKLAHVVNITSMAGFQGSSKYPGLSVYSSSKAALTCLTECLASEFKDSNIRFNGLALGATRTEMLSEAFPGLNAPVNADTMGEYIARFSMHGHKVYNGAVLPVTISNP
ncbi:MAG: SDR family NAD(P)-dependent oxidoreductase [Bacteroidota bacterium]